MEAVSLTTFLDFVSKAGTPKFTVVKNWKNGGDYDPAKDLYKPIRDQIIDIHRDSLPLSRLDDLLAGLTHKRKMDQYPALVAGFRKWLGKSKPAWFEPQKAVWAAQGLSVNLNPELGLEIKGVPHLIKLYFKAAPLARNRVGIITHMMNSACIQAAQAGCRVAVLDIRSSKLFTLTPSPELESLLQGEAAYWTAVWKSI